MSAETKIAAAQMEAAERTAQETAQKRANDQATNDVAEQLMELDTVAEETVIKAIEDYQKENPSVAVTPEGVREILKVFDIEVVTTQVVAEVVEVVQNPLAQAALRVLSILKDNIELDTTPDQWLSKSSAQIISVLTENRRGKSALSATGVWEEIIKANTAFALRDDLKELFIYKFSNLRTN